MSALATPAANEQQNENIFTNLPEKLTCQILGSIHSKTHVSKCLDSSGGIGQERASEGVVDEPEQVFYLPKSHITPK